MIILTSWVEMYPQPTSQKSSFFPKYGQIFSGISDPLDFFSALLLEVTVITSILKQLHQE